MLIARKILIYLIRFLNNFKRDGFMNNKSFPITMYTWKTNFSIDILGDLFLGFDAMWFFVILLLPFFIVTFILKTIFHFKYAFHEDKIISYNIFGFKKIIKAEYIKFMNYRKNNTSFQIQWKKDRGSVMKKITVTDSSAKKLKLSLNDLHMLFTSSYIENSQ